MVSTKSDPDGDDDFNEIYKEYTGPLGSTVNNTQDKSKSTKQSLAGSDEEDELRDPNAVPTDFTSREAKVWEAKSKATERNWKKRKEEEMICKLCGESDHFTQGCPSTLGANRKSQDFFERVPARDKHVRSLFTEKVIERIERDVGCKIRMDEKFLIVSGKDRLILRKGVDAVHKVREDGERKGSSGSHRSRSRSPDRSPLIRARHPEFHRSHTGQRNGSNFQQGFGRQDKVLEERIREDRRKFSRGSPQAYGNDRARNRSKNSKSPGCPHYTGTSSNLYNRPTTGFSGYKIDGWDTERRVSDVQSGHQFRYPTFPQALAEVELEYQREVMELEKIRDKEEDEENAKHRETLREMRDNYMKKLGMVRVAHAKQWEEFMELDAHRRQQLAQQQISASGYGGYRSLAYPEYEGFSGNPHYGGPALPMDPESGHSNHMESYPSRPHESYGVFQHQRRVDFRKAYNRY